MSHHEPINFDDLSPIEIPVSIGDKKYVLREASGDAACKWHNALLKTTKLGPDGRPISVDGIADTEPLLVSLCLFHAINGQDGRPTSNPPLPDLKRPVSLHTIRSWPQRIQKALFEKAKEISQLNEGTELPNSRSNPSNTEKCTEDTEDTEDTEESLQKSLEAIEERLERLRMGEEGHTSPKQNQEYGGISKRTLTGKLPTDPTQG